MENEEICVHIKEIIELKLPEELVCEECIKTGSGWVHLRTCQTCGATLCCDKSDNKHMTHHYNQTHHAVIISAEPHERWLWCYEDEIFADYYNRIYVFTNRIVEKLKSTYFISSGLKSGPGSTSTVSCK